MTMYQGGTRLGGLYWGSQQIAAVYYGSALVYLRTSAGWDEDLAVPGGAPGAEEASHWTSYNQSNLTASPGYYYTVSVTSPHPWNGQVIALPEEYWADADAGLLKITRLDLIARLGTQSDYISRAVDCLAADHTFLGGKWETWLLATAHPTFTEYSVSTLIPPGTRKIRVHQRGLRTAGTENSVYFKDVRLRIERSGVKYIPLYAIRGGQVADWTVTQGAVIWADNYGNFLVPKDETGLAKSAGSVGGSTVSAYTIRKDFPLAALGGAVAASLAAGTLKAYFDCIHSNAYTNDDDGQAYIQSIASGVGQDIADTGRTNVGTYGTHRFLAIPSVNPSADTIRICSQGFRTHGSYLDVGISYVHAYLTIPAP